MVLHVFNPEHDLALANNEPHFTAPHVARHLRADIGYIAAIWSKNGDYVWVEDVNYAKRKYKNLSTRLRVPKVTFVSSEDIRGIPLTAFDPWGWDSSICEQFRKLRDDPVDTLFINQLRTVRELSNRKTSVDVLRALRANLDSVTGESAYCTTYEQVAEHIARWRSVVLKMPWCSSGRGLRFVDGGLSEQLKGWVKNVLSKQYGIVVEPYYNKVKDFAMEFESLGDGRIVYRGLSLFSTLHGAYTGNIVATEHVKEKLISRYMSIEKLNSIKENINYITGNILKGKYRGVFGVDMMIVACDGGEGFLVHPCVEVNLRRTMGDVALSLSSDEDDLHYMMHTDFTEGKFQFRVRKTKLQ
jgi:hypothetical protein